MNVERVTGCMIAWPDAPCTQRLQQQLGQVLAGLRGQRSAAKENT